MYYYGINLDHATNANYSYMYNQCSLSQCSHGSDPTHINFNSFNTRSTVLSFMYLHCFFKMHIYNSIQIVPLVWRIISKKYFAYRYLSVTQSGPDPKRKNVDHSSGTRKVLQMGCRCPDRNSIDLTAS